MFLCKQCLGKNWIGVVTSLGPCECCEEHGICDNYPSKYLPEDWHNPEGCKALGAKHVWYDACLDELYLYEYPNVKHANPNFIYVGEFCAPAPSSDRSET